MLCVFSVLQIFQGGLELGGKFFDDSWVLNSGYLKILSLLGLLNKYFSSYFNNKALLLGGFFLWRRYCLSALLYRSSHQTLKMRKSWAFQDAWYYLGVAQYWKLLKKIVDASFQKQSFNCLLGFICMVWNDYHLKDVMVRSVIGL